MMGKDFSASFWGLLCRKAWIYCPHRVPRTVPFNILQPSPGKESQVPTEIEEWGCWNLLKLVKSLIKSTKSGPEYAILQTLSFCEHAHLFGCGSIPISTIFSGLFTSINPSYDLGFTRGTRLLTHPHFFRSQIRQEFRLRRVGRELGPGWCRGIGPRCRGPTYLTAQMGHGPKVWRWKPVPKVAW